MHRYLPLAVFVVVSLIGLGMTAVVYNAEEKATVARFEVVADEVVDRLRERVTQHVAFLVSAHSFFAANDGAVSKNAFKTFVSGLDLETRFEGLQGVGYAPFIPAIADAEAEITASLKTNYDIDREVWPETDQRTRTPIKLLEPNNIRNVAALGYDMFSDGVRRSAMQRAAAIGRAQASAPVQLVQEITSNKQAGFLVYVPFYKPDPSGGQARLQGFVFSPFRAGDLLTNALDRFPKPPAVIETRDEDGGENSLLFKSPDFDEVAKDSTLKVKRSLELAGRTWTLTFHELQSFRSKSKKLGTFALGIISVLLAGALAATTRAQFNALATARQLQAMSEKSLQDKDMMLQEMKHRIKNSFSRVLAMARQTAANTETIDDFSVSFSARLQAMANAQDMLTRSHWERADLRELLSKELEQVFGMSPGDSKVSGPAVELNERATQALGLTFHELATNAVKYGGISEENGDLCVQWKIQGRGKTKTLVIDWEETSGKKIEQPGESGFGTRLIDANIKGELAGTIERTFKDDGLHIRITMRLA